MHVYGHEELEVFRRVRDDGDGSGGKWVLHHSFRQLYGYLGKTGLDYLGLNIIADGTGFFVLSVWESSGWTWFVSVDVETMALAVLPEATYRDTRETFTCSLPWPRLMRACCLHHEN